MRFKFSMQGVIGGINSTPVDFIYLVNDTGDFLLDDTGNFLIYD